MTNTTSEAATCLMCGAPTDSTVTGTCGTEHGVMCEDCQFWCDGNIDAGQNRAQTDAE